MCASERRNNPKKERFRRIKSLSANKPFGVDLWSVCRVSRWCVSKVISSTVTAVFYLGVLSLALARSCLWAIVI